MGLPAGLTEKVGPLPLWGWGLAGGGVLMLVIVKDKAGASSSSAGFPITYGPAGSPGTADGSSTDTSPGGGTTDPAGTQTFDLASLAAALNAGGKNVSVTTPGGANITTSPAPEPVQTPGDVTSILQQMMANLKGVIGTIGITLPGGATFSETTSGANVPDVTTQPVGGASPLPPEIKPSDPPPPPGGTIPLPSVVPGWLEPAVSAVWQPMSDLYKSHRVTVKPGAIGAGWDLANLGDITASTGLTQGTHLALPVGYNPGQDTGTFGLAGTNGESGWHKFTRLWDDTMHANAGANPQGAATYALAVLKLETNGGAGTGFNLAPVAAARVGETFAQYMARMGVDTSGHLLRT